MTILNILKLFAKNLIEFLPIDNSAKVVRKFQFLLLILELNKAKHITDNRHFDILYQLHWGDLKDFVDSLAPNVDVCESDEMRMLFADVNEADKSVECKAHKWECDNASSTDCSD